MALECWFDKLSDEVLELVLSRLPVTGLLNAGQVCKKWCSVIRSQQFDEFYDSSPLRKGWFFQCCVNYFCSSKNHCYGYDPETNQWHLVSSRCSPRAQGRVFPGSPDGSLYFSFTLNDLSYKREFLSSIWEEAPSMNNSRNSPLLGVVEDGAGTSKWHQLIVAGGVSYFEDDERSVEIFNTATRCWEVCESLPIEFRRNCSRHWMTSAVANGKFYIAEIYSGAIAAFDLKTRLWSSVRELWPTGVVQSHLLSWKGRLLLAGSCFENQTYDFRIWNVDEERMECGEEFGRMPAGLSSSFFGPSDDGLDRRGEGLQCVACGDMVYIFFPVHCREQSRENQVVLCDLSQAGGGKWILLPVLPSESSYNYAVGLCSPVKLRSLVCDSSNQQESLTQVPR